MQPDGYDGGSGGAKKGGSRRRGSGGASPRADATSEGAELLLARKKRRETIQGREAKQYVDRFLEDEARTLRSQIRMWGKDGERLLRGGDSWLGWLDDLRKGL